jgi:hypothetical protein
MNQPRGHTRTPLPARQTALALLATLGIVIAAGTVTAPPLAGTAHAGGLSGGAYRGGGGR